jgi:hypothetical protein
MELPSRTRQQLRRVALSAALGALLVPATAGAATKLPTVSSIAPKAANVGDALTIHGKNFRRGKSKNTVLFKRDGGKALFVKAGLSTAKSITVVIPKNLEKYMVVKDGKPVATRFRVRILTTKLSRKFTAVSLSPTIGPERIAPASDAAGGAAAAAALDPNADKDGDGLLNGFEIAVTKTDAFKADSDGDGVPDGFEFRSAVDLNNDDYRHPVQSLPYPGKRGYPNPLDGSDAGTDFDGDSLTLSEEYTLWRYTIAQGASPSLDNLTYSDGLKYSIHTTDSTGRHPALATAGYDKAQSFTAWLALSGYGTIQWPYQPGVDENLLDVNHDGDLDAASGSRDGGTYLYSETNLLDTHNPGYLSDDERDEDADGLSNYVETHGPLSPSWWTAFYDKEKPYAIAYAGTNFVDADSDGDGMRDGADDQDHDDIPNIAEVSRNMAGGHAPGTTTPTEPDGRVNPFNPCLPDTGSRSCPTYIPVGAWAPFDGSPNYLTVQ